MTLPQASLAVSVLLIGAAAALSVAFPPAAAGAGLYGLVAVALAAGLGLGSRRDGRPPRLLVLLMLQGLAAAFLTAAWLYPAHGGAFAIAAFCLFLHGFLLARRPRRASRSEGEPALHPFIEFTNPVPRRRLVPRARRADMRPTFRRTDTP